MKELLNELEQLNLPKNQYALFGSWPLWMRWLRACNDIDLIVTKNLWNSLVEKYPDNLQTTPYVAFEIWNIEIIQSCHILTDRIEEMIENADIIDGFPCIKLEYLLEWKEFMWREKDLRDVEIIKNYQNSL